MEIVLRWLDDLDDAVFAVVLAWERVRRRCIQIAAAAAGALSASAVAAAEWVLPLAAVAAAGVTVAVVGAALATLADAVTEARRGA